MQSILEFMNDDILVESSYNKIAVLDVCYQTLSEDLGNQHVVDMAVSYTHSMLLEILENAKEALFKLYQRILSVLNNYVLNSANLIDKYRNYLIDRFPKLKKPLIFKTYEYPKLKDNDYPMLLEVKSPAIAEREIRKLMDQIFETNMLPSQVEFEVNRFLRNFAHEVLDAPVNPLDLKKSVRDIVYSKVRGREIERKLTQSELNVFIDEIKQHKSIKDDLNRTKTNMLTDYTNLKNMYLSISKQKQADLGLRSLKYPEEASFQINEYNRFADINVAITRLFNGLITIYSEAFNTKLQIINDKIANNRKVIEELMIQTGMFASMNAKNPNRQHKPFVPNSTLKT